MTMVLLALTGGIGAGKSTIARRLAEHGAVVIDADQVARDVVAVGEPALQDIFSVFGVGVRAEDGSLNRPALGALVFGDEVARKKLNAIVHPAVHKRTMQLFSEAPQDSIVVYDVPLLVETKNEYPFDKVIVASAPEALRVERLMELRGMTESEAQGRIASQATEKERLSRADIVIDTSGSLESTYAQVDAVWKALTNVD